MKSQWTQKNINLNLLAELIKPFFSETNFETTIENTQEGRVIQAVSRTPNLKLRIRVTILGQPDDFTVDFSTGTNGRHFSPSTIAGYLTTMFGGGYIISSEAKKREALEVLENDFWRYTQMRVADLVDSATRAKNETKDY